VKKPASLQQLLVRVVPALAADPTRLAIFVDAGRIAARAGRTLSFEYRYKLNIVLQDYAGDRDAVVVPVLAWIAEHQPDLLDRPDGEPVAFESEILDADSCDLSMTIELTEAVAVLPREEGGYEVRHQADAAVDVFPGDECATLWQLFLRDQLIAEHVA
jgi:hypothetical protein